MNLRPGTDKEHEPYAGPDVRLAFGRSTDGRIRHISEVASGLGCGCVCPACDVPLVAKRGAINEDHFAHHTVGICRYAPETAAHAFGKQLLEETRRILLPEVTAVLGERFRRAHKAQTYVFDDVRLEHRLGDIIPDVVLRKGDRELLVEIAVTHRCDERKIQRIRDLGISAIEVDLSSVRFESKEAIAAAILETAPRQWLFNPHIDRMSAELKIAADDAAERRRRRDERRIEQLAQRVSDARLKRCGPRRQTGERGTKHRRKPGEGTSSRQDESR